MEHIKTISNSQEEIIKNIITLHCPTGIQMDPTFSKGIFYKNIEKPKIIGDLCPQVDGCKKMNVTNLNISDESIESVMFDPPFLAGYTKKKETGIIGERFSGFRYISDLYKFYEDALKELHRILKRKGILIFKCQDTVSSGKQHWSHVYIINEAEKLGFYLKDLFVLLAKNRIIGHNHQNQKHARKYHSYFLVFEKK